MKDKLIAAESRDVKIRELIDSDLVKLSEYADNEKVSINLRDAFPKPYTLKDAECFLHLKTMPLFHFKSIPL